MIRIENLTIGYGSRILLQNVGTRIPAGQLTALIGRNGTGKSTLLRAIAGLNRDYSGRITINGERPGAGFSRTLAFVNTERVRIPNMRCRDLVALGRAPYTDWIGRLSERDDEIVGRSLAEVGMEAYADRTLDRMSDGECQRVMIARALAQETPVLLLDEPTGFLDLPNRHALVKLLARLAHEKGKCVLFSTHELDIATRLADNIMVIEPPHLHNMPVPELLATDLLPRLFGIE